MSNGWIKIDRKIQDHWVWKKSDYAFAWIDLILLANHKEEKIPFDNKIITIKKGQHLTSIGKLSERWHCSRDKVRNILNLFEQDGMILRESNNRRTLLTLVNYGKFQKPVTTDPTTVSSTRTTTCKTTVTTTDPTQTRMNKNDKEIIKNEKEKAALQPNPFGFEWE